MLEQTRTIPVVFVIVADPVGSGFVQSLARPGANATGFTIMEPTVAGKWLELLKEIAPRVNRAAFLFNPATTPYRDIYLKPFKAAAESLAVEAIAAPVHDTPELESVVAAHAREPNGGLIVMPDGFLNVHRSEIVLLAARHHLPAVYPWRFFTEIGGLLSYGSAQSDMFRTAAIYVDRILKGEKSADLPVLAPTNKLVVNLKTAKALGLDAASLASAACRRPYRVRKSLNPVHVVCCSARVAWHFSDETISLNLGVLIGVKQNNVRAAGNRRC